MPEEGFVIEQRDLGGWGLVEVVSTQELPICSAILAALRMSTSW